MMDNRMVIVHPYCWGYPGSVVLTLKDRPLWQEGRLNLVGGKVENGESIEDAAVRELKEETGLTTMDKPRICGAIYDHGRVVYAISVTVFKGPIRPRQGETEKTEWYTWERASRDDRLIPNLRIIIPLLAMGVTGWQIIDFKDSKNDPNYQLTLLYPVKDILEPPLMST